VCIGFGRLRLGDAVVPGIRLAIVDEHEIFRRGIQACLADDPAIDVAYSVAAGPLPDAVDLAVVSATVASQWAFECPLVVCGKPTTTDGAGSNWILGTVSRNTLTTGQLLAAIHAAAVGLHVDADPRPADGALGLNERQQHVLRLLADGADTLEIAEALRYSERTVKSLIQELEQQLGARSRAQAVAIAIKRSVI
jgi:DNA-binding NarL/FixJ family response regulator